MSKQQIAHLKSLREELAQISIEPYPASPWANVQAWIAKATPLIRRDWGSSLKDFQQVTTEPRWLKIAGVVGESLNRAKWKAKKDTTENAIQRILGFIDGLIALEVDTSPDTKNARADVEFLCRRFSVFARQLGKRDRGRPPIEVQDEYDVQYLLHALLKVYFDDIRAEEWTPSYAGGASRVDFLLKKDDIVIEAKKTRAALTDRKIGEQLLIDIARYKSHPDCATLLCFVYDPEHRIGNPKGLETDLSGASSDDLTVIVIIEPP